MFDKTKPGHKLTKYKHKNKNMLGAKFQIINWPINREFIKGGEPVYQYDIKYLFDRSLI